MAGEYYNQLMQIKEAYENLEKKIWLEGKMIYKKTEAGIFVPTDISRFYNLCKYLNMQDFKSYLELGSGDGRITRAASIFTKATGIEIDKELHKRALSIGNVPQGRKIGEDIFFIHGNYMDYDFSDYDIIYWAPDNENMENVEEKLLNEMEGILIMRSYIYLPKNLYRVNAHLPFFDIYINPEKTKEETLLKLPYPLGYSEEEVGNVI